MSVFFSKTLSVVFHPIFMPLFTIWLMFNSDNLLDAHYTGSEHRRIYAVFFITTVLMPAISFYILRYNKLVSSFAMNKREERFMPYLATLVYYGVLYYLLRSSQFPWVFLSAMFGSMLILVLVTIINLRMKISAHAAGIAGAAGVYAVLMKYSWVFGGIHIFAGLLVLCGLVCSARLSLHAHRHSEVYLGALLGFFVEFVVMNYKWSI